MYETETEVAMPWVYNDGGFVGSGLDRRRRKHGNGIVRAIAIAEGRDYGLVYGDLRTLQLKLVWNSRSKRIQEHSGDPHDGVFPEVYKPYLLERGWLWTPTMKVGSGVTMHLSYEEVPDEPRMIIRLSKNLTTVIAGTVYDTHDPSREGTRAVYGYFTPRA